ncbi:MAG: hypothetical protein B7O98_07030 [Zestosphaera tikiterensis]|uniref:Uncharacterized protein n=1 Tax=Zestosphaera tikiterensis TaxID=1973259 RepID=A0A2R7Y4D0_9CREN|nr:MAG: hypothetical protein B7O98_07030 [Zestosphaera tikiterensis]
MYRVKPSRGQAEIIGATIALGLLVLAIASMLAIMQRTSATSTTNFAKRVNFENERLSEKLSVTYNSTSGECILRNYGSLDTVIIRIWNNNQHYDSKYGDHNLPIVLKPNEEERFTFSETPQYIVTSRGNVIPFKNMCEELKQRLTTPPSVGESFIKSEDVLTGEANFKPTKDRAIVCSIEIGNTRPTCYVAYNFTNYGKIWRRYNPVNGWESNINARLTSDTDRDGVNELTLVDDAWNEINFTRGQSPTIRVTFVNSTIIDDDTDVIYVTYRLAVNAIVSNAAAPFGFSLSSFVELTTTNTGATFPAAVSFISIPRSEKVGGSYNVIAILEASVAIPRKAYSSLSGLLQPGIYNLTITVLINNPQQGSADFAKAVRLESVTITGAEIKWYEKI